MIIRGGLFYNLITIFVTSQLAVVPVFAKSNHIKIELPKNLKPKLALIGSDLSKNNEPSSLLQSTLPSQAFVLSDSSLNSNLTESSTNHTSPTTAVIQPVAKKEIVTITQEIIKEIEVPKEIEVIKEVQTVKEIKETIIVEKPTIQKITEIQQITQQADLTNLNGSNLTSGIIPLARLDASISLLGQTIESSELAGTITYNKLSLADSITNADVASNAAIHHSKLDLTGLTIPASITDNSVTDAKLASGYAQLGNGFSRGDKIYSGTFSFDSSYATDGELVDLTSVFATSIKAVIVTSSKGGKIFEIDESLFSSRQFKLKSIKSNSGNEDSSGANLSTITNVRYLVIGQ